MSFEICDIFCVQLCARDKFVKHVAPMNGTRMHEQNKKNSHNTVKHPSSVK